MFFCFKYDCSYRLRYAIMRLYEGERANQYVQRY